MQERVQISTGEIGVKRIVKDPEKPTIVFLHDSFGCIELWRDFPEKLSEKTNNSALMYDRLGYGKSDPFTTNRKKDYLEVEADVLVEILDKCNIDNVILFGHSDGATIALIAAAKYPKIIAGVISEAAHVFVEEITLKGINEAVVKYENSNLKDRLEKYHGAKTDDLFWAWANIWRNPIFQNWNIDHLLTKIKCSSMLIQGKDDEYGSLKQIERIEKGVSAPVTKLIIPQCGHTPHHELPELILEKVQHFVKTI